MVSLGLIWAHRNKVLLALVLSLGVACKKLYDQNVVLRAQKPSVSVVTRTERVYQDGKVVKEYIVKEAEKKYDQTKPVDRPRTRYVEAQGNERLRDMQVGVGVSIKNTYDIGYSFEPGRKTHRLALRYRF